MGINCHKLLLARTTIFMRLVRAQQDPPKAIPRLKGLGSRPGSALGSLSVPKILMSALQNLLAAVPPDPVCIDDMKGLMEIQVHTGGPSTSASRFAWVRQKGNKKCLFKSGRVIEISKRQ